jgi:hypothetical protein
MPRFTFKLHTLATSDPNPGSFFIQLKPDHKETLAHAIDLQGEFSTTKANGYVLLDYPPCWHLAEFRSDRLIRFLPLTRTNLQLAFGRERGDRYWHMMLFRRRYTR